MIFILITIRFKPDDIHALQFRNGSGWIEYRDTRPNPPLNSVADFPDWAVKCIAKWEEQYIKNPPPETV